MLRRRTQQRIPPAMGHRTAHPIQLRGLLCKRWMIDQWSVMVSGMCNLSILSSVSESQFDVWCENVEKKEWDERRDMISSDLVIKTWFKVMSRGIPARLESKQMLKSITISEMMWRCGSRFACHLICTSMLGTKSNFSGTQRHRSRHVQRSAAILASIRILENKSLSWNQEPVINLQ